jgi:transposase-like protein
LWNCAFLKFALMLVWNGIALGRDGEGTGMLICPTCRNPMRIRTIEIVELGEQVRFACDSCHSEAVRELSKSSKQPQQQLR